MRNLLLAVMALLVVCAMSACIKKSAPHAGKNPEEVVKEFIALSSGAKEPQDKVRLQSLCGGDLRRTLERMNDEAFRLIYIDSDIDVKEVKVMESKVEGDTAKIAYQISLHNKQGTDETHEVNTREVELKKEGESWFISNIRIKGVADQVAFTRGMIF